MFAEHREKKQNSGEKRTRQGLVSFVYWFLSLLYLEGLVHFTVYDGFHPRVLYAVGLTAAIAALVTLLLSLVPGKIRFPAMAAVVLGLTFLYGSQMVYEFIFGTMYSMAQMGLGGAALASFWRETLMTMWENLPCILALLVPLAGLILMGRCCPGVFRGTYGKERLLLVLAAVLFHGTVLVCLRTGGTGMFTDYYYYYSDTVATNQTAERFGILTMMRLELIGSFGGEVAEDDGYFVAPEPMEEGAPEMEYNVLDLDFEALNGKTEDTVIQTINDYCAKLTGTNKNEYTGMLSDYNLIVLCAESFDTGVIDPEMTPTLYRLANEGIVFNNYYNSFPNTTTDGEYAMTQGLWPDTSRDKGSSSLYNSRNSYLPFTLGNLFR